MLLMFSILCADPELRATIKEIETNEWVTQPVDMSKFVWNEVLRNTEFHSNSAGDVNRDEELKELKFNSKPNDENQIPPVDKIEPDCGDGNLANPDKLYLLSKSF